jgi:lipopolysaccharide transport system ATP-binding protein
MSAVLSLCTTAALLEGGRVVLRGTPQEAAARYLQSSSGPVASVSLDERVDRWGEGGARMTAVQIRSTDPDGVIRSSSRLEISIRYRCDRPLRNARFVACVHDEMETAIFAVDSEAAGGLPETLPAEGTVECTTEPIGLTPGRCRVDLTLMKMNVAVDKVNNATQFHVESDDFFGTGKTHGRDYVLCMVRNRWSLAEDA